MIRSQEAQGCFEDLEYELLDFCKWITLHLARADVFPDVNCIYVGRTVLKDNAYLNEFLLTHLAVKQTCDSLLRWLYELPMEGPWYSSIHPAWCFVIGCICAQVLCGHAVILMSTK